MVKRIFVLQICVSGLLAVIGPVGSQGSGFDSSRSSVTPNDCKREVYEQNVSIETQFQLMCNLRTINSEFDQTNFSVIPSLGTVSLSIQCAEIINQESKLLNHSFQHLHQLEDLSIKHCKIGRLPRETFAGLSRLKNLTIQTHSDSEESISLSIVGGTFSRLSQLTSLDLSHNKLWTIPERELCQLPSLTYLNMSENTIKDIRDLGISGSDCSLSVGSLDLSHNDLSSISSEAFENSKQLKVLILNNNKISQVHDGALNGLNELKTLDLSENNIVALPARLFLSTPELQQLKLDNNRLSVISSRLFHPLKKLIVMDLSGNLLKSDCETCLSKKSFQGLNNLIFLDLSMNKISSLQQSMFEDLNNLQSLDISGNEIQVIPSDSFHGLNNLYSLKLSRNKISSIELRSLNGLSTLNSLDLENNSISSIPQGAFRNCSNLKDLNLYGNDMYRVPEAITSVSSLNSIDLGGNFIKKVDNISLSKLHNLIGLKLDHNKISFIEKDDFGSLPQLQILNLGGNNIVDIERGSFNQNKKLQAIRLDANKITDIVGLFSDLPSLRWLNISDNRIQKFDYFLMPKSLNWLDIHKNQIEDIGNYFDKEDELNIHTMDISFNKLQTISSKSIPDRIQTLSLNDNLITRIDPLTFSMKHHLIRVDLYANKIVKMETSSIRLPPRELRSKKQRPVFSFGGNPFLCDCNLEWLQSINNEENFSLYPIVNDLESIYCQLLFSKEDAFVPLVEAKSSDFLCPYSAHCFALCHCCDFDACDCEMTCPDNCTCYHDQSWSVNIVECQSAGFWEPPTAIPMDATQVFLSGNRFDILGSHSFIGRKNLKVLHLNNSNIEAILNYTFYGLRELRKLHLENNNIRRLEGHEFLSLRGLRELFLHENKIDFIEHEAFSHLDSLEVLRLDDNRLFSFPDHFSLHHSPYLVELSLSSNPWSCDCQHVTEFKSWVIKNQAKIIDSSKLACFLNNSHTIGKYILEDSDCSSLTRTITVNDRIVIIDYLPLIIIAVSVLTVAVVAISVFIYYRSDLQVWVFSQWGVRLCHSVTSSDYDSEKMYDAYITYSIKDQHFVSQVLSAELEHGDPSYRVCLHYQDIQQNNYVADSIIEAVASSKRTILVLSNNFVIHEWSRYDVKSALHDVLKSRGKSIILVLGDIPYRDLDPDLRHYLKSNTTIHWSDRLFWNKLRFHLPPVPSNSSRHPTVPINYCHPIYEVPQYPAHHTLGHHHNIYEQGTLDSQLTAKIY